MSSERVTIKVESNIGEDGPLTVSDTLHQLLDAFDFLSAAIAHESGGETVRWRLVGLTKNSPATATAEAYSIDSSIEVAPLVHRGKKRFSSGLSELSNGHVSSWMATNSHLAKALFKRNLNGVGRTTFDLEDDMPVTVVIEKTARQGLRSIDRFENDKKAELVDLSRSERGSIEANVAEAKTYNGRPALYVKERLSGKTVPCVLTEEAASEAGPTHSWHDTWSGKRVRVKGQIFYDKTGAISRISASKITDVNPADVDLNAIRKLKILTSENPTKHLDEYWGYDNG
jgi:hypothetical protein